MDSRQLSWGLFSLGLFLFCLIELASSKKLTECTEENCEVCVKFLGRFIESLDSATKSNSKDVEKAFKNMCKTAKKDDNRLCYYVGGSADSATSTLGDLSGPISWGMPANKVCMKLYKKDEQICDLKYDKVIDLATVNLKKLKVKDLKQILSDWDVQCRGCTEKTDFIKMIEEKMPKYDAEAASKRAKSEL